MDELNLSELRNKCLTSLYSCIENIPEYIEDDSERAEEFDKLKTCVNEYCKMEFYEEASKKAIQSFEKESDVVDWASVENQYERKLAEYSKKHAKYDKHPFMKELEKHIMTAKKKQVDAANDSELAITETRDTYIDPISKRPIINPLRNKICNHVYESETIESILGNRKNKGCPYMGCTNKKPMQPQDLEPDKELELTLQRTQQTQGDD